MQASAAACAVLEDERRIDMRQWIAFAELRDLHELDLETAATACFGMQADEVVNAFKMGATYEPYRY